jgi:hypothetical protein
MKLKMNNYKKALKIKLDLNLEVQEILENLQKIQEKLLR